VTSRLSEESVVQALDNGWQSLIWKSPFSNKSSELSPPVDFTEILDAEDPEAAAQAVPRRDMYLALVSGGAEVALDILPLISAEQLVTIMDNEAWHDGKLAIHQAIRWLELYKDVGPEQLYVRFRQLDEEYQVAFLSPYIEMLDEEAYENVSHDEQDKFTAMPCNTLWWRVKDGDEKVQEFVASLIYSSISEDAAYIYSLLGMAAMMPPNEQEHILTQFRNARLEEDGFVTKEESHQLFAPFDGASLYSKWKLVAGQESDDLPASRQSNILFLDTVMTAAMKSGRADPEALDNVKRSFAYLANAVSAACSVEPDDVTGLTRLLLQTRHTVSFGIEVLSGGDVAKAVDILFTEYPKTIFKFALSTVDSIRHEAIVGLKSLNSKAALKLEGLCRAGKFGSALWMIDRDFGDTIGFESAEILKGLFNRFPLINDEIISNDGIQRTRFRPLATVADYSEMLSAVRKLFPIPEQGALQ
jgi:Family of unknown function (DUF6178)